MDIGQEFHHHVVARLMDRRGLYPATSFASTHAVFSVDDCDVFSAVRVHPDEDCRLSELSWASIEEIRLWATMALSVPEGKGSYTIYPSAVMVTVDPLDLPSWDLADEDTLEMLLRRLRQGQGEADTSFLLPRFARDRNPSVKEQRQLFAAISQSNDVTLRGLVCLLKGEMLFQHWAFGEEAALAAYTSMTAALSILRAHLTRQQGRDASFNEVYQFIATLASYGEGLCSYLRDCWDNRIILAHPENRHGAYPIAPLIADDYYETHEVLVSLYRFILIGSPLPEAA